MLQRLSSKVGLSINRTMLLLALGVFAAFNNL